MQFKSRLFSGFSPLICSVLLVLHPAGEVHAQGAQLEEIVVTAQRREQSLQDVPIAINVYSGVEISRQGFRQLEDLSRFSPSVYIREGNEDNVAYIRGFGTEGNSITQISATPIFLDGVHFGRRSMVQTAFLDVARVEVMKGPQPLYFGMNAVAGGFNITSKRPTPVWEGEFSGEYGSYGHNKLDAAAGGPITETLGIRLAAKFAHQDGPLKNRFTDQNFPKYENLGGRLSLLWQPSDRLEVLTKFEMTRLNKGADAIIGCLTGGNLSGTHRGSPTRGVDESVQGVLGNPRSVWAEPPLGVGGTGLSPDRLPQQKGGDCFDDAEYGNSFEGPYIEPVVGVHNEQGKLGSGMPDIRAAADAFHRMDGPDGPGSLGADSDGITGKENVRSWNALLDATYELGNGMVLNSQTAAVRYYRIAVWDNRDSPFATNFAIRNEDYYQYSQQFRLESPASGWDINVDLPGGLNVTAMTGAFGQMSDLDNFLATPRATMKRGSRINNVWEDARWLSGFWNIDLHFLDGQLTLSAGGRVTDIHKDAYINGSGHQWVYDERPCDSAGTDANPDTCATDPNFMMVHTDITTETYVDPVTGNGGDKVRVDNPIIVIPGADTNNLWAAADWNRRQDVPLNWRSGGADAVGLTQPSYIARMEEGGPYGPCDYCIGDLNADVTKYSHQYTLSYTPNVLDNNHTFYAKFATAFKGPVFDTGRGTIEATVEDMSLEPELADGFEFGAKGILNGQRIRYDVALFENNFKDFQSIGRFPLFNIREQTSQSVNIDQRVRGLEFTSTALLTDRLTFNLAGAFMDGRITDYPAGGCSDNQLIASAADAVRNPSGRTVEEITVANDTLDEIGPTRRERALRKEIPEELLGCRLVDEETSGGDIFPAFTKDRSDITPSRTPDWKFLLGLDYNQPVGSRFMLSANVTGFISDAMAVDPEEYDPMIGFDRHGDMNATIGFGPQDDSWKVSAFVRNLLEARERFRPEYDFLYEGYNVVELADSFRFFGVRFDYNFR